MSGDIIGAYTRKDALADGSQIDVSKIAAEMGIRLQVFMTRAVYIHCVTVSPPGTLAGN
jgi:hypothetical protein